MIPPSIPREDYVDAVRSLLEALDLEHIEWTRVTSITLGPMTATVVRVDEAWREVATTVAIRR